ncbi:TonB family protein [Undibacterium sp. TJN25]|uniref:energy transducer TonB n=1 Tax=Undibacterium sp. TJN25 TaxID=3413056 RepID=UPI003BF16322
MQTAAPTMSFELPFALLEKVRRSGSLIVTVLAHLGLIYALQNGLLRHVTQALPKEIFISLVAQEPEKPATPKPAPKLIPVTRQAAVPVPVVPIINKAPAENAIVITQTETPPVAHHQEAAAPATVQQAAPATPAPPKTISGIEYLQAPKLEYPAISRRMGEAGKVALRVLVNEKGRAEKVEIEKSSGFSRLDDAAKQALMRALFKPYIEDGKALTFWTVGVFTFDLNS